MINLFFIRFTDSRKKIAIARMIQIRLNSNIPLTAPSVSARTIVTTWVNGNTARAKYCTGPGRSDSGKKVPLNRNIGVMNRNAG